jgi:hypothetical protein
MIACDMIFALVELLPHYRKTFAVPQWAAFPSFGIVWRRGSRQAV